MTAYDWYLAWPVVLLAMILGLGLIGAVVEKLWDTLKHR